MMNTKEWEGNEHKNLKDQVLVGEEISDGPQ
jgi:hypothetical protein